MREMVWDLGWGKKWDEEGERKISKEEWASGFGIWNGI
jgi:hypothetical protein